MLLRRNVYVCAVLCLSLFEKDTAFLFRSSEYLPLLMMAGMVGMDDIDDANGNERGEAMPRLLLSITSEMGII